MAEATEWTVRIVGVEEAKVDFWHYTKVEFAARSQGSATLQFNLPVYVPREVDDTALVPVARSYLAHALAELAADTASWQLTEEQFRQLVPEQSDR